MRITTLRFGIATTTIDLNPSKTPTIQCARGDRCRTSRAVNITITGALKNSPDVQPPPVIATDDATNKIENVLTENERDNEICLFSPASARGDDNIEAAAKESFQE